MAAWQLSKMCSLWYVNQVHIAYETYLNGTKVGGFSTTKNTIFSDYQKLGHRHYFPQIIFHVFSLIMTLSIYYQYSLKYDSSNKKH